MGDCWRDDVSVVKDNVYILAPPFLAVGGWRQGLKAYFKALRGVVGTSNFRGLFLRGSATSPYKKIDMWDTPFKGPALTSAAKEEQPTLPV